MEVRAGCRSGWRRDRRSGKQWQGFVSPDTDTDTDTDADADADAYSDAYSDAYTDTNDHAYSDTNDHAHAHAHAYSDTDTDTDTDTDPNTYANAHSNTYADADADEYGTTADRQPDVPDVGRRSQGDGEQHVGSSEQRGGGQCDGGVHRVV